MRKVTPALTESQKEKIEVSAKLFVESADDFFEFCLRALETELGIDQERIKPLFRKKVKEAVIREADWSPEWDDFE
jgi:hypothetical protein